MRIHNIWYGTDNLNTPCYQPFWQDLRTVYLLALMGMTDFVDRPNYGSVAPERGACNWIPVSQSHRNSVDLKRQGAIDSRSASILGRHAHHIMRVIATV